MNSPWKGYRNFFYRDSTKLRKITGNRKKPSFIVKSFLPGFWLISICANQSDNGFDRNVSHNPERSPNHRWTISIYIQNIFMTFDAYLGLSYPLTESAGGNGSCVMTVWLRTSYFEKNTCLTKSTWASKH